MREERGAGRRVWRRREKIRTEVTGRKEKEYGRGRNGFFYRGGCTSDEARS